MTPRRRTTTCRPFEWFPRTKSAQCISQQCCCMSASAGEFARAGQVVAELIDPTSFEVEVMLPFEDLDWLGLRPGRSPSERQGRSVGPALPALQARKSRSVGRVFSAQSGTRVGD